MFAIFKRKIKKRKWTTDPELIEYLEHKSLMLNGQLRGSINEKARQMNLDNIQLTLYEVAAEIYQKGRDNGYLEKTQEKS